MKKIVTDKAPQAIGPYSQGMETEKLVFTSGQIPIDPKTGKIETTTIVEQTEQACKNVKAVLEAAGVSMENVIKTTCLLSEIADFTEFNKVYERYFTSKPARSTFAVKGLPAGALIEIEAIAEKIK